MPLENKPLFSVIIPVYNVAEYLPQCIDSVLTQNLSDFELILVDDGSTDNSGKICDQYDEKPNIKIIHQTNAGLSAARNAGVAKANGRYLVFLDSDDYLEPGALAAIKAGLEPNLDALRYQAQEVFDDGRIVRYEEVGFATIPGTEAFNKLARYHYTENAWLYAYRTAFFRENHFTMPRAALLRILALRRLLSLRPQASSRFLIFAMIIASAPAALCMTRRKSRVACMILCFNFMRFCLKLPPSLILRQFYTILSSHFSLALLSLNLLISCRFTKTPSVLVS